MRMNNQSVLNAPVAAQPRIAFFERYLSLWVALCMATGVIAGKLIPSAVRAGHAGGELAGETVFDGFAGVVLLQVRLRRAHL